MYCMLEHQLAPMETIEDIGRSSPISVRLNPPDSCPIKVVPLISYALRKIFKGLQPSKKLTMKFLKNYMKNR